MRLFVFLRQFDKGVRRACSAVLVALAMIASLVALSSALSPGAAAAQGLTTLQGISVTSTNCTPASGGYSCTSPTVMLQGTGADPSTNIVVADSVGLWLGETTSSGGGAWSVAVTLPAGASAPATYVLDAFEINTSLGEQGGASPTISVTVNSNQLLTNGNFGQPPLPDGCTNCAPTNGVWENFPQGSGFVPGWDSTNSCGIEIETPSDFGASPDSNPVVELASDCVSGVTQTVPTVPGAQYTLTFDYRARQGSTNTDGEGNNLDCPADWTITQANENTMAVQWGGYYLVGSIATGSGLQGQEAWQTGTYNLTATGTSTLLEFDDTNPCSQDSYGDDLADVSVVPTETLAPTNTSWESAQAIPMSTTQETAGAGSASQSITFAGETLWYEFPVQPGEQVSVQLNNPADFQALIFSDISQATAAGAGSDGLPASQAESASNNDSSANFSPAYENPAYENPAYENPAYENPAYDNPAYENPAYENPAYENPAYENPAYENPAYENSAGGAVVDALLGESSPAGASTQTVDADTWNATGDFYIEILSDSGGFSGSAYTVTVNSSGGACASTLESYTGDLATPVSGGSLPAVPTSPANPYSTVIVDNSAAMAQVSPTYTGTDGIYSSLSALAGANSGVVLDVSQSLGIQELITQAQLPVNVSCPYAENLEAQGIQDLINTYRAYGSNGVADNNLKYVVIIGDDDVVPFFRYPDAETIGPEDTYQVPLSSTSAAEAAIENDYYLTDDQYGAASELDIDNTLLPIQSAAVGRLVETPLDIENAISRYIGEKVIAPSSTLTTGYSFMAQGATEVAQYFADGVPGSNDTLIDTPPSGTAWTATNLLTSLTQRPHQLVFLGAHFNANVALAADDTTNLTTTQFASAIGNDLENSLVVSTGCHSGYVIDPHDATPLTDTLSWPQAFTEAGATLIAGTGYQFGDSNYVAYSGQLYVDLAQQLYQTGGGSAVPVGTALLDAESQYLASVDQLNGLEEKALLEVTLYGLPMLGVQEPNASSTPVPTPSTAGIINTATATNLVGDASPAGAVGTEEYDLPVTGLAYSPFIPAGQPLSYDTLSQGQAYPQSQVVADPGSPIVPVMTEDVNVPNYTLTGVGFWGGSYSDTSGAAPLTGDPVTDTSEPASPFSSPVYLPQRLTNPNYFGTLDTGAGTELGITPEQYMSDPANPGNAVKRQYNRVDLHVFYSPNSSDAGLASPPNVSDVTATENSTGGVTVTASVLGAPNSVQEVWVTDTVPPASGAGSWSSVDLLQSSTNPNVWTGSFQDPSSGQAVFEVQAANAAGEVSLDNNGGYYFSPTLLSANETPPASTSLSLSGGATDAYGTSANVSASLEATASSAPLGGQLVTFSVGSAIATAVSSPTTGAASATIPLSQLQPGNYTLTASFAGNANYAATAVTEPFTVTLASTAFSLSMPLSGQLTGGAPSGISATLTSLPSGAGLAQKTVYFDVFNPAGQMVGGSSGQTSDAGVAQAGVINLPPGDVGTGYAVSAYFGSSAVPLPAGVSLNATDPDYGPSQSASPASLTVSDPPPTVTIIAPSTVTASGATTPVSYQVTDINYGGSTGTPNCTPASGSGFPLGTTTISCTGTAYSASTTVTANVDVVNAPLSVSVSGSQTYGGQPSWAFTASGFVGQDGPSLITGTLSCSTSTPGTSVGSYSINSCTGLTPPSYYALSYVYGSLKVTAAPLTITASSGTMSYGSTPQQVTPIYSAFANGDKASSLTTQPTCSTTAKSSSPTGSYTTSCTGAVDSNYNIGYQTGTIVVGSQDLLVIASSSATTYGQAVPKVTATYSGFVNGEGPNSISVQPTCTTTAKASSPVGKYTTSCTGAADSDPNYTIVYVNGSAEIDTAPLTITASSATVTYGAAPPVITATYSAFANGDTASSLTTKPTCSTTATKSSPLGQYPTTCAGAVDSNYTIAYLGGTVTVGDSAMEVRASGAGALTISGQSSLKVQGSLAVNSSSAGGVNLSGQSVLTGTGALISPATSPLASSGQSTSSFASTLTLPAEADPDASLAGPSTTGMTVYSSSTISGPGVYSNAVTVSGQTKVQLATGTYVFDKGLTISGQATITSAAGGVLLYFVGGALTISGQAGATLSPLGSGTLQGISLFVARTDTTAIALNGQSKVTSFTGTVYSPVGALDVSGQSSVSVGGLIVSSVQLTGQSGMTVS
jgi:hypothetical protein